MSDTPAIEMSGVGVSAWEHPNISVLENINWTVAAGEYWVIGGLHNSGKSDLLAMAAGLTPPKTGVYRLFGMAMPGTVGSPERLRVGLVFDGGKPFHRLTVAENVALPMRYHRAAGLAEIEERAREILELTELSRWAGRMPGNLGRSWEKRLGLARALILEPELLLLDDPLGGLDSQHLRWWMAILEKLSLGHPFLRNRPITLVVATHNLRPWRERAVSLAVIGEKRFVPLGRRPDLSSITEPLARDLILEEALAAS